MKKIKVEDASVGMIIGRDVISHDRNTVLLTRGTELDQNKIYLLLRDEIDRIYIRTEAEVADNFGEEDDDFAIEIDVSENEDQNRPRPKLRKPKVEEKKEKIQYNYKDVREMISHVYSDVRMGKKLDRALITNAVDFLIAEVRETNHLFGVLKRSEDPKDYLINHIMNVSIISIALGNWLHYSLGDLRLLAMSGLLHDLGKMKISNMILDKPGKLTPKEFEIMKKHPLYGYNYLKDAIGISKIVTNAVLQHHEREDGSGYPLKIKGDQIHPYAKILAIADVFDAITSNKSYSEKKNPFYAQEIIQSDSFSKLDPGICYTFLKNLSKMYIGKAVLLTDGTIGEIVYIHANAPTRPVIKVDEENYVDLSTNRSIDVQEMIL